MAKRRKGVSKKVCKGCFCKATAENAERALDDICIAEPIVRDVDDKEMARCPCEICVVKTMCQELCTEYSVYTDLVNGHITFDEYKEWKGI